MSADNWTKCPQCLARKNDDVERAQRKLEDSYGKVDAAAFLLATEALKDMKEAELPDSMREDYDIGVHDSEFVVDYRMSCNDCGFSWEFKHSQEVPVELLAVAQGVGAGTGHTTKANKKSRVR